MTIPFVLQFPAFISQPLLRQAPFDFALLRFLRLRYCYASFDFALLRFLRLRYATLRTGSLPLIRGTAESRSPLRRGGQGGGQGFSAPIFIA